MIRNIFVSLPNRLVTLHEYCLVSCKTRFLTTSVLLTLKCSSSTLFVMLTRELSAICLLPLNQNTSIGKFPTAIHVIVTSSDTLAGVFAGAVLMLAGTAVFLGFWVWEFLVRVGGVRFPGEFGELATFSRGSLP